MEVVIVSRETIKPSFPTPHRYREFRLSLIDQLLPSSFHIPIVLFYSPATSTSDRLPKLKTALAETLTRFYTLAGRRSDASSIDCSDQGVCFTEARAQNVVDLAGLLSNPVEEHLLDQLLPDNEEEGALLSVQATAFPCGGLALGTCISHVIADAISFAAFLNAWAAAARGDVDHPHPRTGIASIFFPPVNSCVPLALPPCKCVLKRFVIGADEMKRLRSVSLSSSPAAPTRVEAVSALIWASLIRARAKAGGSSTVIVAVDARRRMPAAGALWGSYFGNMATFSKVTVGAGDDNRRRLAEAIRAAVRKINLWYALRHVGRKAISTAKEVFGEEMVWAGPGETGRYMFSSWCRFPIYDVDFGWGRPVWAAIGRACMKNFIILMDRRCDEGVEAWVSLEEEEMREMERDEELLAFATAPAPVSQP